MPPLTLQQAFELAIQHHQARRLPQAEALYRQILAQHPQHAEALHMLGLIAYQVGRYDLAMDLIGKSIALKPNYPEALNNLGNAQRNSGQLDTAIATYRQAIALSPNCPETYYALGNALKDVGQFDAAIAAYHQAIGLKPDYSQAHINLGNALRHKGQLDASIASYRRAIALMPDNYQVHINLGNALRGQGQLDLAIAAYRQALSLKGDSPEAHSNLGVVLTDKGQLEDAMVSFRTAIQLNPKYPAAHSHLGNVLMDMGQLDQAIASHRAAIQLRPDYAEAHSNLALALLLRGDFLQGWQEYEWRRQLKDYAVSHRNFVGPRWNGSGLNHCTILLHAEQGFGDVIQFSRYIPLVAKRGGNVVVECQHELKRLFQYNAGGWPVCSGGEPRPVFDVQCPLGSLPMVFGTTLQDIPSDVPYLRADAELSRRWQERLSDCLSGIKKVGLVWAGGKLDPQNYRRRSMTLAAFTPLARSQGVRFYSLQKGEDGEQAKNPPVGLELTNFTGELNDFADTAALIANLDVVISIDTAVAHLAGAMGKPVWVLLPFVPDWRWMLRREDSPWYPTMRLFRQATFGDWPGVIRHVAQELAAFAGAGGGPPGSPCK